MRLQQVACSCFQPQALLLLCSSGDSCGVHLLLGGSLLAYFEWNASSIVRRLLGRLSPPFQESRNVQRGSYPHRFVDTSSRLPSIEPTLRDCTPSAQLKEKYANIYIYIYIFIYTYVYICIYI